MKKILFIAFGCTLTQIAVANLSQPNDNLSAPAVATQNAAYKSQKIQQESQPLDMYIADKLRILCAGALTLVTGYEAYRAWMNPKTQVIDEDRYKQKPTQYKVLENLVRWDEEENDLTQSTVNELTKGMHYKGAYSVVNETKEAFWTQALEAMNDRQRSITDATLLDPLVLSKKLSVEKVKALTWYSSVNPIKYLFFINVNDNGTTYTYTLKRCYKVFLGYAPRFYVAGPYTLLTAAFAYLTTRLYKQESNARQPITLRQAIARTSGNLALIAAASGVTFLRFMKAKELRQWYEKSSIGGRAYKYYPGLESSLNHISLPLLGLCLTQGYYGIRQAWRQYFHVPEKADKMPSSAQAA
jgi:hypothetical protein